MTSGGGTEPRRDRGARFFRCALQVNTFGYVKRHRVPTTYTSEADYNGAVVAALVAAGVEVIAITDHYRIKDAVGLTARARAAGIIVFPGFEAVSKDGVHFLCLMDPSTPFEVVQAKIAACGVHDEDEISPLGEHDSAELLTRCHEWGIRCIAAHVIANGGLLSHLSGQPRTKVWRQEHLLACSIAGPPAEVAEPYRAILANRDAAHRRDRPIAILNCQDISDPTHISRPGTVCLIKMSEVTAEGLRQAFLDPDSRVRLVSEEPTQPHPELLSLTWESEGFLRGCRLDFNENLNVLVGGRGTGKSTIIESLRYVLALDPLDDEVAKQHDSIVRHVLRSGTKIALTVCSYQPNKQIFTIERTVPNPPQVKDEHGNVLQLAPADVVPRVEVYGQHEISQLAKSPERLTQLLDRFMEVDREFEVAYQTTRDSLAASQTELLGLEERHAGVGEQLAMLPGLEQTLTRYAEAGVETKLQERTLLLREETLVGQARVRHDAVSRAHQTLGGLFPLDMVFLAGPSVAGLPDMAALEELRAAFAAFEARVRGPIEEVRAALGDLQGSITKAAAVIEGQKARSQSDYERTLRELQKENIDGEEFMRLRKEIERLKLLKEQKATLDGQLAMAHQNRRNLLARWEELKRQRFQRLERVAKRVSRQLPNRLRVRVTFAGNRMPLIDCIKQGLSGRLSETLEILRERDDLSLGALAAKCREGANALVAEFELPAAQAARLAGAGPALPMAIEELELPHTTQIELNIAPEGRPAEWRPLRALSTGQKATALLLLLLLDSDAPLIIDQPEDDLDNRFITEGIVPEIRRQKRRRQFVFATHNANVPVLGDAELIIGLSAEGDAGEGYVTTKPEHMGSIDKPSVAALVEEILEGGQEAFTTRRLKYGF